MVFLFSLVLFFSYTIHGYCHPVARWKYKPNSYAWVLISSSGFTIVKPNNKRINCKHNLFLMSKGSKVTLNNKQLHVGTYYIIPHSYAEINNLLYKGPLSLHITAREVVLRANRSIDSLSCHDIWKHKTSKKRSQIASYKVRVLLEEMKHTQNGSWIVSGDNGFKLFDPHKLKQPKFLKKEELKITSKRNAIYINKLRYEREWIHIVPDQGFASINGQTYHGSFIIYKDANRLLLVNHVDLEEYVYSVLRTESWPGWPLEVNKVFAVACRSYVMAMMKAARKTKQPYHVKNTNEHQTYQGMHNCLTCREAVEQTRGVFLSYNREPIVAMFDCCCGGIIPADIESFDFKKAPYLARPYACTHCKRCKIYSWEVAFDKESIHPMLCAKEVKVAKTDKAGIVKEVHIKSGKKVKTVTGKQLYAMFKEIKSFHFGIQSKKDKLVFKGKGYGHHVGLCQWGAREMVRDGWKFQQILQFYYPGTQFLRLTT